VNMAKAALYLEWIAFCLRKEFAPETLKPMSNNYPPGVTGREPQIAGEPEEEGSDRGRKMDSELRAIAGILRTLEDLPEVARRRVIAYLAARFTP
jgi:hypothetical protein